MKVTNLLILLFVFFMSSSVLQAQKTGHLNRDNVLGKMAEVQEADNLLKNYIKTFEDEIRKMQEEYAKKMEEYKAGEKTMNAVIKQNKIDELNALNDRIKKLQTSAEEEVIKKRTELFNPIVDKFNNALKKVAKKKGYKYIIDTRNLLYFESSDNITKLVETELGIK